MHQARHHRVMVFAERIVILARAADIFPAGRDVGAAQRLGRVIQAHQAGIIGRDAHRQRALVAGDGGIFVLRQAEDPGQFVQGADAGAHLPAPVIPFRRRGAGIEAAVKGAAVAAHRKAQLRLRPRQGEFGQGAGARCWWRRRRDFRRRDRA